MKFARMVCARSSNIGDDIQSLAAARLLPRVDQYVDRECLDSVQGPDPVCTIMNGWFMHGNGWPPSAIIRPIFAGFHVIPNKQDIIARHAEYLRSYEPIGVRDRATAQFLRSLGINAEVTYCVTLTLPPRAKSPARGRVVIVDGSDIKIPRTLRGGVVRLTHSLPAMSTATKIKYAKDLIDFYRDNARLIITTRLHCALPCIAMGIPVVYFGNPRDSRTKIVSDIGGTIYSKNLYETAVLGRILGTGLDMIDWSPQPIDISAVRARLVQGITNRLEALSGA